MFEKLTAFITGIVMTVGSFFGVLPDQNQPPVDAPTIQEEESFGGFSPVGGITYRLKTSLGTSDTTIVLSSLRVDGIPVTMSTLNTDIGYATLDPQSETRKEFVSFTTITQNADGSATLTGVSRGLAGSYPYTASSTLRKAHPGQSIFVLSDAPQVFNEYTRARSNETITGQWTFSSFPITPSTTAASATTSGWVELATGVEAASSTDFGSTGFRLGLSTLISTSTAPVSGNVIPVTRPDGKLDSNFISNFTGTTTFTGTSTGIGKISAYSVAGSYIWTKATGTKIVHAYVFGAGGGGGGGAADNAATLGSGATGGGGGGYTFLELNGVSTTVTVNVGTGGTGGNGGVALNNNGSNGSGGSDSSFGSYAIALGGGGGNAGTQNGAGTDPAGAAGGAGLTSFGGASGANTIQTSTGTAPLGGGMGGDNSTDDGTQGFGRSTYFIQAGGVGGTGNVADPGDPGIALFNSLTVGGSGGGGGEAGSAVAGGAGGAGIYGSGGGGGGASNGGNGGAGGRGGDGLVVIIEY